MTFGGCKPRILLPAIYINMDYLCPTSDPIVNADNTESGLVNCVLAKVSTLRAASV